ncbi:hypothetical protein SRB5_51620 [Streptomyces sp. RB5]|uniref:ASCH domain-containing protein n=1 Tax=Streptomyces smaragdinus TaxID=2585196 RepID=A0A7K0CNC0_9ACTN|nr:ASCH domain-containing protein [Streptomyces smaragdinus]MQY14985.1 hypothetical protein [Streptomyces smaragdinus]
MRALTIRQPWADAIAHGAKRVENRTWTTDYRGPLLIHAGAQWAEHVWGPSDGPDVRSAVLAVATLTDIHPSRRCCDPWGEWQPNVHHWVLTDVRTLARPVPATGRLSLWTPSDDLTEHINTILEDTP